MAPKADEIEQPSAAESRAELERIIGSDSFAASPRLASFLRYVVETTLAGRGECLKGYTVGVEALGRREDFDPQTDPIVRVEAGRLRAALARYYAGDGINDPVNIELARGSYVPRFCRRTISRGSPGIFGRLWNFARTVNFQARPYLTAAGLLVLGASAFCAIDVLYLRNTSVQQMPASNSAARAGPELASQPRRSHVGPVLYVEPVKVVGTPGPDTISVATLRERLLDAFARFDDVNIVSDLAPAIHVTNSTPGEAQAPDYRLATLVRFYGDRSASLMFRLLDVDDGTIVWSRSFDQLRPTDEAAAMKARVIRGVAMPLLQPFGVIHARERLRLANADAADPYRCLLESHDYLRSFDKTRHAAARACLERAVAKDPTLASGYIQLARVYLREHQFGIDVRPNDPPALDRAFELAYRGLELKPNSARAHFVLFDLDLARGDFAAAKPAGERAVALNPNDMPVVFHYGALLVLLGEVEKGEAIVREIASESAVPPGRLNFILFVAAYLKGDLETAAYHAKQVIGHPIGAGCLARALIAAKKGDRPAAVQEMECLRAQQPGWRTDPRAQLKKLFPAPPVLDKIAADLMAVATAVPN